MNSFSRSIVVPRLSQVRFDRVALLYLCLIGFGFVSVFVAVQRPLLAIEGLCALAFLAVAQRAPLLGLVAFFAITFLGTLVDQVAGGSFSPGLWAAKGAGGALVLVWIFSSLARREFAPGAPAVRLFVAVALTLLIWAFCSALWAAAPQVAVSNAARLAQGPLLMIVIVAFVRTASALTILCYTFIAGATLSALAGLSGLVQDSQNGGRLAGGIGDPNFTAAVLIPAIALGLFMALAPGRSRLYRGLLLGTSGLCMVGVFLTQSRGGVIALCVVFLLAVVFAGRARAQVLGVSLVVVSTAAVYLALFAPPHALGRLSDIRGGGGTGRTDLWAIATQVYKAHPVLGIGLGNFTVVSANYAVLTDTDLPRADVIVSQRAPVHNTYLEIAAELGTVGILLLLGLFGVVFGATRRGVQRAAQQGQQAFELMGRGLFVGAAGMLTAFFFLSAEYEKELWLTLGLLLAFANIARQSVAPTDRAPD
jgi:O-antigen ligase